MKIRITGAIVALLGAALASFFPLPANLAGIPIALIGTVIVLAAPSGRDWRNL